MKTHASLTELNRLMAPPAAPVGVPSSEALKNSELSIGRLPEDYNLYINAYGVGKVDDFISIFVPYAANSYVDIIRANTVNNKWMLQTWQMSCPNNRDSDRKVLQFGITDNGDYLCWSVASNSDRWQILVFNGVAGECEVFDMSMAEFLVKILSRQLVVKAFPQSFPIHGNFVQPT
jgi:hypothetical protein